MTMSCAPLGMQSELVAPSRGTSKNNKKAVPEKAAHIAEQMYFFFDLSVL